MKKIPKRSLAILVLLLLAWLFLGRSADSQLLSPAQTAGIQVITETPEPSPAPSASPKPAATPKPTATPRPSATPKPTAAPKPTATPEPTQAALDEHGSYTTAEDVALYLITYGHLPDNFITKRQAEAAGWTGGSLEPYCPGKCIGGSRFGNYEGLLPSAKGRTWTECDINTLGARSRGAERLVFSNDGLIYYTDDHYESFTLLYGDP